MSDRITLEDGAGGGEMMDFLKDSVLPYLEEEKAEVEIGLRELDDGAAIELEGGNHLVFTTDSHVVRPRSFPGGDLGSLAVSGTINDLAVMGAEPMALSSGLVIEEGFSRDELGELSKSMGETSAKAGVPVVTGDTKVVGEGEVDGVMINTSGVGICEEPVTDSGLEPGDRILVTGTVGDHGMTIIAEREGFESSMESDIAPVNTVVEAALEVGGVKAMKDPTRGGLAQAMNEMASKSEVGVGLEGGKVPVSPEVSGAGELLGIDPLTIANEGKVVIGVEASSAEDVLESIRGKELGSEAEMIGECTDKNPGKVVVETKVGGKRLLKSPRGEPIPRIC